MDSLKQLLLHQKRDDATKVDLLNEIGYNYWIERPDSSEIYGIEALALARKVDYPKGAAFAQRIIGVAHWTRGNYEEGYRYLLDALEMYSTLEDTLGIANVTMNIGLIYSDQQDYENAFTYFFEAYTIFKRLELPNRLANTANHLGRAFYRQGNLSEAQKYFEEALQLSLPIHYDYGLATAYLNLGILYHSQNKPDQALGFCKNALDLQIKNKDWEGAATSKETIGGIYLANGQYRLALESLEQGKEWAQLISSKKILSNIYLLLKAVHARLENFKAALHYQEQYAALQDSLLNTEKIREIVRLENKYKLEKQEQLLTIQQQEMSLLQKDQKINTLWTNILAVGILLMGILVFLVYRMQKMKNEKNRELFEKKQALSRISLENAKLKEKKLEQELVIKNKELTSYALNFIQKNKLIEELNTNIHQLKKQTGKITTQQLNSLNKLLDNKFYIDKDWEDFKFHFEHIHHDFFHVLKQHCPDLTNNELRLCALLKLNMNLKESANILGISPTSVKTARYRLRKKFGLAHKDNLVDYILSLLPTEYQNPKPKQPYNSLVTEAQEY